ncbi:MAG: hypothetical protein M1837_001953 [Sclerophora amabilis]|nr:MAG: hypothetical protein M1837_001953 [Sclerophora amabilis]
MGAERRIYWAGAKHSFWRHAFLIGLLSFTVAANSEFQRPGDVARRRPSVNPFAVERQQRIVGAQAPSSEAESRTAYPKLNDGPPTAPVNTASHKIHGTSINSSQTFPRLVDALEVMQSDYFELWQGTWPDSIDWTAAVLGTYVSAALSTISTSFKYIVPSNLRGEQGVLSADGKRAENLINKHFSQLTSFYFGQDAFALRNEAYDDMLWVVLGWLEGIKFIILHSDLHYGSNMWEQQGSSSGWYGTQFIPVFAHRARLFYDIASQGWDTKLCGGGMVWNPYLTPYKNAITNELYIAASVGMYLHFPGDDNPSPFAGPAGLPPAKAHDPKYLTAALEAYKWLTTSNMTNAQGLFVDGFHISGYGKGNDTDKNTKCDERNEMVYTYNQGVLLSGHRGLWESTGASSFLEEGHSLIDSVLRATGWEEVEEGDGESGPKDSNWAGLGRNGILEEICDASGTCSQNAQTFKGIFFHHLTIFCLPLPSQPKTPGKTFAADVELSIFHAESCASYTAWIKHNARAASQTRNGDGQYGTWWGNHRENQTEPSETLPAGAVDYRNAGVPREQIWRGSTVQKDRRSEIQRPRTLEEDMDDVNDRGRGRTVETQGGGIAVLRALWEIVDRKE